jgi:hypothetical protein
VIVLISAVRVHGSPHHREIAPCAYFPWEGSYAMLQLLAGLIAGGFPSLITMGVHGEP